MRGVGREKVVVVKVVVVQVVGKVVAKVQVGVVEVGLVRSSLAPDTCTCSLWWCRRLMPSRWCI